MLICVIGFSVLLHSREPPPGGSGKATRSTLDPQRRDGTQCSRGGIGFVKPINVQRQMKLAHPTGTAGARELTGSFQSTVGRATAKTLPLTVGTDVVHYSKESETPCSLSQGNQTRTKDR